MSGPAASLSTREVAQWFARSLGEEKAVSLIDEACASQGLHGDTLAPDEVKSLLDSIATEPGLIGMTAMLVKSRLHFLAATTTLGS